MDIGTLRGIGTLMVFVAFCGLLFWVFSSKRKAQFDDAANLPFDDEGPLSEVKSNEHSER